MIDQLSFKLSTIQKMVSLFSEGKQGIRSKVQDSLTPSLKLVSKFKLEMKTLEIS